jgi:CHAT domain-containing protein
LDPSLLDDLHWLYQELIMPVEDELDGRQHIFIVPVGSLNYLPFAALVRSYDEHQVEFAVQRFTFGLLPTMYLLDLVLRYNEAPSALTALMGDPDGSMPGADAELSAVQKLQPTTTEVRIGSAATFSTLKNLVTRSQTVHLATHAFLDPARPERSYVELANGYRLTTVDAMMLPFGGTKLVVLSACETGVGVDGLEYATLARAFAQAGVPSVMATLWRVSDGSQVDLMTAFYQRYQASMDLFVSLAGAQREMISKGGSKGAVWIWSAFAPFGKP